MGSIDWDEQDDYNVIDFLVNFTFSSIFLSCCLLNIIIVLDERIVEVFFKLWGGMKWVRACNKN